VNRTTCIPYHQNVYDLLWLEPGESPEAVQMILEHELEYEPLPVAVVEWYSVPCAVSLTDRVWEHGMIWDDLSGDFCSAPLSRVLADCARVLGGPEPPLVYLIGDDPEGLWWRLELDGSDDPPVWFNGEVEAPHFSEFLWRWMSTAYLHGAPPRQLPFRTTLWRNPDDARELVGVDRRFANGLWLRTPDEPFQPPVIDFLTDQFGEPGRTPRPGNVTTYTFRPEGGTIRITADEPALTGGLSAWWVHAQTRERLAEFARLLREWGTLRQTLRADTDAARDVLAECRG
jgi:hypothetical protein